VNKKNACYLANEIYNAFEVAALEAILSTTQIEFKPFLGILGK
jgi:hypothetical protein